MNKFDINKYYLIIFYMKLFLRNFKDLFKIYGNIEII